VTWDTVLSVLALAIVAGACFEGTRLLIRKSFVNGRHRNDQVTPPGVDRSESEQRGHLSEAERQAFRNNDPDTVDRLVRKLREHGAQTPDRQRVKPASRETRDENVREPQVQVDASLRQNLRLKFMYDEIKIDRAIAHERQRAPNADINQLMRSAIERWERDNR
jgi:hypothetical protein